MLAPHLRHASRTSGLVRAHTSRIFAYGSSEIIVRDAALRLARQGWPVRFYEDIPYVMREGAVEAALAETGGDGWQVETLFLEPEDFAARLDAIATYRSSLPLETFAGLVRDAGGGQPAERTWRVS